MGKPRDGLHKDLFRPALEAIIDLGHPLARLAREIDWDFLDQRFSAVCRPGPGQPPLPSRLVAGLLILKHMHDLSDEALCACWLESPYYQFFCGEESFQHRLPFEHSSLTRWRQRLGEEQLVALLQESLSVAHKTGALSSKDLERVAVDTTVQPKAVAFPTDARLLHKAIVMLGREAKKHDVPLRQSYVRVAKWAALMAGRLAHAKQFKRHNRQLRFLHTRLGRLVREIWRKTEHDAELRQALALLLSRADQIRRQKQRQRGWKLYSWHAPEVECIGKGKARAPYELGRKVSVATPVTKPKGGQFVLHTKVLHGNPYDGHTLGPVVAEMQKLTGVACAVIEFGCLRIRVSGHALGVLQGAAGVQVGCYAGCPEGVIANLLSDAGEPCPPAHHVIGPLSVEWPITQRAAAAVRCPEEKAFRIVPQIGKGDVVIEIGLQAVVDRHLVDLAAFFPQPQPPALAFGEVIFAPTGKGGRDPREGEHHQADQSPVAVSDRVLQLDWVEELAGLFRDQHRRLAAPRRVFRATHRMGRVGREDLACDQPVKEHPERRQVLLHRRRLIMGRHGLNVGGYMDRLDTTSSSMTATASHQAKKESHARM